MADGIPHIPAKPAVVPVSINVVISAPRTVSLNNHCACIQLTNKHKICFRCGHLIILNIIEFYASLYTNPVFLHLLQLRDDVSVDTARLTSLGGWSGVRIEKGKKEFPKTAVAVWELDPTGLPRSEATVKPSWQEVAFV